MKSPRAGSGFPDTKKTSQEVDTFIRALYSGGLNSGFKPGVLPPSVYDCNFGCHQESLKYRFVSVALSARVVHKKHIDVMQACFYMGVSQETPLQGCKT
jgi:hypothetical protein